MANLNTIYIELFGASPDAALLDTITASVVNDNKRMISQQGLDPATISDVQKELTVIYVLKEFLIDKLKKCNPDLETATEEYAKAVSDAQALAESIENPYEIELIVGMP